MRVFPPLTTAEGSIELPLADATARRIVAALCGDESSDALAKSLTAALERDASFTLWAICRAAQCGSSEAPTLGRLAQWLAGSLLIELCWPDGAAAKQNSSRSLKNWADLAARSLGVAVLAAELAVKHGVDRDRAYLLGLLHAARRWLEDRADAKAIVSALLPPWLMDALEAIEHNRPGGEVDSAEGCVAAALRLVSSKRQTQAHLAGFRFDRRRHSALVASVRAEWMASDGEGLDLAALLPKLARLQTLEGKFQQTLAGEKLESLKELAYGAGHEINNPLANISARAQTLLQSETDPDRRRLLAAINSQAFRAHEMIADMMLFARPPQPRVASLDLVALLRELAEELAPLASAQQSELVLKTPDEPVTIQADKTQIAVAVRAVCANALEAVTSAGRVEIELHSPAPFSRNVQITISDDGPGISPHASEHLFDPFFSGREAGRGLGFGLSKCWRIVTMHGGQVEAHNNRDRGARFAITLPVGQ